MRLPIIVMALSLFVPSAAFAVDTMAPKVVPCDKMQMAAKSGRPFEVNPTDPKGNGSVSTAQADPKGNGSVSTAQADPKGNGSVTNTAGGKNANGPIQLDETGCK